MREIQKMTNEPSKIKSVATKVANSITVAAFGVTAISILLPFVAYFSELRPNHIWPAFIALFLLAVSIPSFKIYKENKNMFLLFGCHALLCASVVFSNMTWAGIPFVDILTILSVIVFGTGFLVFFILMVITLIAEWQTANKAAGPDR